MSISTKKIFYLFFLKYFFFSFYSEELNIINNSENKKKQELLDKRKKYMQKGGAIVAGVFTGVFIKIFMDKKKKEKPEPKRKNKDQEIQKPYSYKEESSTESSSTPPESPISLSLKKEYLDSQRKQPPAESSNISSTEIEEREVTERAAREELEKEMKEKIEFLLQYYNMSQEFITKLLIDENIKDDIRKIEDMEIMKEMKDIIDNNDMMVYEIDEKSREIKNQKDKKLFLSFSRKILNIYSQVISKEKLDGMLLKSPLHFEYYKKKSILATENNYINSMNIYIGYDSLSIIDEKKKDFMTIYNLIPFCFHTFITFFEFAKDPDELLKNVYSLIEIESLNDENKEIFRNVIQKFKEKAGIIVNKIKDTIANKNLNEETSAEQIIKISKILWITHFLTDDEED